ncbi:ABC-type uncharacterized transport system permease subunit [Idiomarina fontislapidosi]|uniref:ABC transporter permease n=1 Tax=Idiomarina fontislapidosi TaxID=263723 RepID=A0A432XXE2_9GAMM|nr:cytochrome c biogenesis protein CcsA [Idiomarina fontislapidosi]PYE32120.1 ABC-type uncharacterized transport system permease subunit [Idiomarina fontislapidosi]RUO53323.1 ABC transporter permease [Idiomarina fontislapidosi]
MLISALLSATLVLYVASALFMLQQVFKPRSPLTVISLVTAVFALICHGALIYLRLAGDGFDHLNVSSSLSIVAWLIASLSLFRVQQANSLLLKPVIYLFAALSALLLVLTPADLGAYIGVGHGLIIHIVLSLVAYGVLALATLYAIQASYINYLLKTKKTSGLFKQLPPLMNIERYFFRLLSAGTLLLILAIGSGFAFLDNMFAQSQAHKTILAMAAALVYIITYLTHKATGLRGKPVMVLSIIGTILLTLGYFGSRFVKDIILS